MSITKTINDTWGHDVGDEAIIAITRHLQLTLRGSDLILKRFGGDEFAVIMCGTPPETRLQPWSVFMTALPPSASFCSATRAANQRFSDR